MNVDGSKLRRLREDRGLTLRALAAAASLSPSHLSMVEAGTRGVSPPTAARLAGVLGVAIADLRSGRP